MKKLKGKKINIKLFLKDLKKKKKKKNNIY